VFAETLASLVTRFATKAAPTTIISSLAHAWSVGVDQLDWENDWCHSTVSAQLTARPSDLRTGERGFQAGVCHVDGKRKPGHRVHFISCGPKNPFLFVGSRRGNVLPGGRSALLVRDRTTMRCSIGVAVASQAKRSRKWGKPESQKARKPWHGNAASGGGQVLLYGGYSSKHFSYRIPIPATRKAKAPMHDSTMSLLTPVRLVRPFQYGRLLVAQIVDQLPGVSVSAFGLVVKEAG
jgi:hypothetical protein